MRKIAFGYSTRCNLRCAHCVAAEDVPDNIKMDLETAKGIIQDMAVNGVNGISFTAGEPFLYFDDFLELVAICNELDIYTRIVTNCYWAKSPERATQMLKMLRACGLSQLRLSYSRWHQEHVPKTHVLNAAHSCMATGLDYFISFVTDFSAEDDGYEQFLRDNDLKFFPEPVIYAGRAKGFTREKIRTDYQKNCCEMNPYLAPDLNMYACCDAGSNFTNTNVFLLGNLKSQSISQLFSKSETNALYSCIRTLGLTNIASFAGMKAREIITYRKCDLCRKLLDDQESFTLVKGAATRELQKWVR